MNRSLAELRAAPFEAPLVLLPGLLQQLTKEFRKPVIRRRTTGSQFDQLGDDHDLCMLRRSVEAEAGAQRELFEPGVLSGLIEQRRRELESAALQTGAQIYAEKPSAFCDRLARYWGAWRDGKKTTVAFL